MTWNHSAHRHRGHDGCAHGRAAHSLSLVDSARACAIGRAVMRPPTGAAQPERRACQVFAHQIITEPAVAADAEVLDILGAPELWRLVERRSVMPAERHGMNAHGCGKDRGDASVDMVATRIHFIADMHAAQPGMDADLHGIFSMRSN